MDITDDYEELGTKYDTWHENITDALEQGNTLVVAAVTAAALVDIAESLNRIAGLNGVIWTKNANAE